MDRLVLVDNFYEKIIPQLDYDEDSKIGENDVLNFAKDFMSDVPEEDILAMFDEVSNEGFICRTDCINGINVIPFKPHRNLFIEMLSRASPPDFSIFKVEIHKEHNESLSQKYKQKYFAQRLEKDGMSSEFDQQSPSGSLAPKRVSFAQKDLFEKISENREYLEKSAISGMNARDFAIPPVPTVKNRTIVELNKTAPYFTYYFISFFYNICN
jgi:hypothetical protein